MQATEKDIKTFRRLLVDWWKQGRRDFPWRYERTTYRTAIAELMLRRTRADQVVPVFEAFVRAYPDLASAATADEETLHSLLEPLGLRWRAENMIAFLREAAAQYGDRLPADRQQLLTLPGIGDYVSAAIACFAANEPVALIDTNVVRVLARLTGRDYHAETRREGRMRALAMACVDPERPAEYHYALLDFGAMVCRAQTPRCTDCTMNAAQLCEYGRHLSGDTGATNGAEGV